MRSTNGYEWIQFVSYLIAFRFMSTRRQMRELFLCFGIRMYYTINTMSIDIDSLWRASTQSSIQMSLESCLAWHTTHNWRHSQRARDSGTTSGINCIRFISSWTCVKHDIYGIYSTFNCWQYKWCIKSNQVLLFGASEFIYLTMRHLGAHKTSECKAKMTKWIWVWRQKRGRECESQSR